MKLEKRKGIVHTVMDRYGFIWQEDGTDIFFHCTAVNGNYEDLYCGAHVEYYVVTNTERPKAIGVTNLSKFNGVFV